MTPASNTRAATLILRLFSLWNLSNEIAYKLLGHSSKSTLQSWEKNSGELSISQSDLIRIGALLDIHAQLRTLFGSPENVYHWIHRDNSEFSGHSPLSVMMSGEDGIGQVRQYLSWSPKLGQFQG
ncbi:MbcA/ParS/Xre antitoxin family protein [Kordiimonas lacus]